MRKFQVKYAPRAREDLQASYDWGVEFWGRDKADRWVVQIDELMKNRLSQVPLACPLAPENADFEFELRHLVVHRYRILFMVSGDTVFVLRIRGPFSGGDLELD